eukprot:PhM_4_TR4943/c0_g1_i3/m.53538
MSAPSATDKWNDGTAEQYAASTQTAFMVEMNSHTVPFILNAIGEGHEQKLENTTLIDVGCGACTLLSRIGPKTPASMALVGTDLDQPTLDLGFKSLTPELQARTTLIAGDCTHLLDTLNKDEHIAALLKRDTMRLICVCGNTIGILPTEIRHACLVNMFSLMRPHDLFILQSYDKDQMRVGFEQFYSKNPGLTGKLVTEDNFDFDKGTLYVPESGYRSQWFNPQNCGEMLSQALAEAQKNDPALKMEFKYEQKVNGLFVSGRRV